MNKYTGEPEVLPPEKTCVEVQPGEHETVNKYTGEPMVAQSSSEYTVEVKSNCKKYKPTDKISLKSQRPKLTIPKPIQKVNKYTGEPVVDSVEKQTYTPEARDVPEYNPTPINQLKPSPSKYQAHAVENENDQEYDPQSNFSTACILEPSQPMAIKRPFTYDPTTPDFNHPAKKAKGDSEALMADSETGQSDIGAFSNDEEDDEEIKHLAMEDERDSSVENEEEDSLKNSMITDVKVFESLLMPVMAHKPSDTDKNLSNSKKSSSETKTRAKKSRSEKSSNHDKSSESSLNKMSKKNGHHPKEKVTKIESLKSSKHSSSSKSKENSSSRTSSSKALMNGSSKSSEKQRSSQSSSDKSPHKHSHKKSSMSSSSSSKAKSSSEKDASKKHSSSRDHKHIKQSSHDKKSSKSDHSKHSSDKKKEHSSSGHNKQESRSKGSKETHKNSTEKESKKRNRSVSLDSNGSKRKIIDLNVDLFGADSDIEDDVPALISDEEEDPYEECLRIYNENNVSKPSPKKHSERVCYQ